MRMLVDCWWLPASGFATEWLTASEFFKPWPGIKFWRESFGHAGARVRSAARTSLFQSLWWLESEGRFGAWPAFALACSGPSYCCCRCLPRSPCVPPFIHLCFQTLPKGSMPVVHFARALGGTMWWRWVEEGGMCRSWGHFGCSGSWLVMQPVLRADGLLMLLEECGLMSSRRARGLHLGRLSRRINDQKIIFRLLNNPFMLHERGKKVQREFGKKQRKLSHSWVTLITHFFQRQ